MKNMKIDKIENANEIPQRQRQRDRVREGDSASDLPCFPFGQWKIANSCKTCVNIYVSPGVQRQRGSPEGAGLKWRRRRRPTQEFWNLACLKDAYELLLLLLLAMLFSVFIAVVLLIAVAVLRSFCFSVYVMDEKLRGQRFKTMKNWTEHFPYTHWNGLGNFQFHKFLQSSVRITKI